MTYIKLLETIKDIIMKLIGDKFSGILTLTVYFKDGGIRDVKKSEESTVK